MANFNWHALLYTLQARALLPACAPLSGLPASIGIQHTLSYNAKQLLCLNILIDLHCTGLHCNCGLPECYCSRS